MLWQFALRVFAALGLGVAIGLERQWRQHSAGLRTNALVSLGASLYVSVSVLIDHESSPTRVAAQVVSGLGFLGGGVILREGVNVRGLNTAATVWCSGAIGTLAGLGYLGPALVGAIAVLAVHLSLRPVVRWIDFRTRSATDLETLYQLRIECAPDQDAQIRTILLRHVGSHPELRLQGLTTEDSLSNRTIVLADISALEQNDRLMEDIVARASIEPAVKAVSWQKSLVA